VALATFGEGPPKGLAVSVSSKFQSRRGIQTLCLPRHTLADVRPRRPRPTYSLSTFRSRNVTEEAANPPSLVARVPCIFAQSRLTHSASRAATMEMIFVPSASFPALPATARVHTRFTAIHPSRAADLRSIIGCAQTPGWAFRGVVMFSPVINRGKRPRCSLRFPQVPGFTRVSPFGCGRHDAKISDGSQCAEHSGDRGH
jgi:hypothetical protein